MAALEYASPFPMLHAASLLSQKSRLTKFALALERLVDRTSHVVDLGTGSGVLAMLAARLGARRVTAVDIDATALRYAQRAAEENGLSDRIEFVNCHFKQFLPAERADIVVCEMLSDMMLVEQQIPASVHAVQNILRPGGVILPQQVHCYCVPVECDGLWSRFEFEGLVFPPVPQTINPGEATDLADLQEIVRFDLASMRENVTVDRVMQFSIVERGVVHGLAAMFESTIYDSIRLQMSDGWRELLLPLNRPITVTEGDLLRVHLRYRPGEVDSLTVNAEIVRDA